MRRSGSMPGENPAVVEVEKWYIKDINNLPKATN